MVNDYLTGQRRKFFDRQPFPICIFILGNCIKRPF